MSYGVKYRLDFEDILGNGKRIDILKKSYSGSVLDLIGQGEPVVISWKANDDPYDSPIIGSTCKLNLFTTDTVSYDNFYEFDEREYKVNVKYKDGAGNFQMYWEGFIVVDRFQEQYKSNPVAFSLNAYDNLGTLDNFSAPLATTPFNENSSTINNITRIATLLSNTGLDFDIHVQADLMQAVVISDTYPRRKRVAQDILINAGRPERLNKFDIPTGKKQLQDILKAYNCRIFQSYGRWYIVENSNVFDTNVKSSIHSTVSGGGTATNIRSSITSQLVSASAELLDTDIYNSSGTYQSTTNESILKIVPTNLKNIGSDLIREYIQPINEAEFNLSTTQASCYEYTRDIGFEYGSYGYDIVAHCSIVTDDVSLQGNKSIKLADTAPSSGQTLLFNNKLSTSTGWEPYNTGVQATLAVFVEKNDNSINNATIQFKIIVSATPNLHYWDEENSTWTTSDTLLTRTIDTFNAWQKFDINLTGTGYPTNLTNELIGVQVFNLTYTGSGFVAAYFDNVGVLGNYFKPSGQSAKPDDNRNLNSKYIVTVKRTSATNVYSDKKIITGTYYFNATGNGLQQNYSYFRTRDGNSDKKPLLERHLQNLMNDLRDFQVRYQGTFRNLTTDPLSLHNRIWFNFGASIAQDPQSSYIDGLTYSVKSANAKIIAHLPNSDDDISCVFRISGEE